MLRGLKAAMPAWVVGAALAAAPVLAQVHAAPVELAQVQSQPLPPPAGTPQTPQTPATPPSPPATPPAASPPSTPPTTKTEPGKTEPGKTPTPIAKPKPGQAPAPPRNTCPDEKVDINASSADTLKKLPQIGGQRSNAIIKARPYAKPEDLVTKKVLKKAVFEKIKPCVTASGVAADPAPSTKGRRPPATKPPATATPVPVPAPSGGGQPATKPPQ